MSSEDELLILIAQKDKLAQDIANIEEQLLRAKHDSVEGLYHNKEWFRKAQHALRMKKNEMSTTLMKIGIQNKAIKQEGARRYERTFMEIAKCVLDIEVYNQLLYMTNLKLEEDAV